MSCIAFGFFCYSVFFLLFCIRRDQYSTGPLQIVGSTVPEQHGWNLPVQLARLPDRNRIRSMKDDPRLTNLAKTLDSCRATGQDANDAAETAVLTDFAIQEGDLIIIGSDGEFQVEYIQ